MRDGLSAEQLAMLEMPPAEVELEQELKQIVDFAGDNQNSAAECIDLITDWTQNRRGSES